MHNLKTGLISGHHRRSN